MLKSRRPRVLAATIHGQALEILVNNGCWGLSHALVLRPRISPMGEYDKAKTAPEGRFLGADDEIRTRDPHPGNEYRRFLERTTGFEPATLTLAR